jgi:hypothetical protein
MNSGLWIFRVRLGSDATPPAGAGSAGQPAGQAQGGATAAEPAATDGPDPETALAVAGLLLGLVAVGLVVRARRSRAG